MRELTEVEGTKLFHSFATILRKHSVSDKPNAFSVIFNLFLAKLYDEQKRDGDELEFKWKENEDPVDFQVRLHNLHKEGLNDFLKKEIDGIYNKDFDIVNSEELRNAKKRLLKFNKFFSIKDVFDDETFEQNQRVLQAVVKMLQQYQIRYPRKQKYLSDFFELLLTTGLKQEVGQYFTPPPITKFIVRSLPLHTLIEQEINNPTPKLPAMIDYAAGSGHFITEILEEYQDIINELDSKNFYPKAKSQVEGWRADPYSWATTYAYGIEKDYRLAKVAKVGCYFYGDGLAQIIHGDGLDSLTNPPKSYIGLLQENTNTEDSTKNKFSIVVANPPYSVKYCKEDLEYINSQKEFSLYTYLTDNSNEIECLFVERTKQLLKDGGVAGIILPSSILSNEGIYTKTREIILQYFEIIAITELGSNTFMATGTNTVVLFLRRRNNNDSINFKKSIDRFFVDFQDVTLNKTEKPFSKYVSFVWENISFNDYISLLKKEPNDTVSSNEIYKEYRKTIKNKTEKDFWNALIEIEKEKILYFILAYPQKVVLVKTGEKDAEKRFLGYEFSNRKGNEGMHPMQRGKSVDDCTKLYNEKDFEDNTKASFYIYKAFLLKNNEQFPAIDETLQNNISYVHLVDMLTFDRTNFAKNISTNVKKKVRLESKWEVVDLGKTAQIIRGVIYSKSDQTTEKTNKVILTADNITLDGLLEIRKQVYLQNDFEIPNEKKLKKDDIFICFSSGSKEHLGKVAFLENNTNYYAGGFMAILRVFKKNNPKFIYLLLNTILRQTVRDIGSGSNINNLSSVINDVKIPIPPIFVQQQIVSEIEVLENREKEMKWEVDILKKEIIDIMNEVKNDNKHEMLKLGDVIFENNKSNITVGNAKDINNGNYPFFTSGENVLKYDDYLVDYQNIYLSTGGNAIVKFYDGKAAYSTDTFVVKSNNECVIKTKFIFYFLKSIVPIINEFYFKGVGLKHLQKPDFRNIQIPLPSLPEQQKIVSEIEQIETEFAKLEKQLSEIPKEKETILRKYL